MFEGLWKRKETKKKKVKACWWGKGGGGGVGEGRGSSCDYLRIDTLVMKVSRKGHGLSLGGGHSSPSCVMISRSCCVLFSIWWPGVARGSWQQQVCWRPHRTWLDMPHIPLMFKDGPVQSTNHVINTCCVSVILEDEASSPSLDHLDPWGVLVYVRIPDGAGILQERPYKWLVCQLFGFDGTNLQILMEES